MIPDGELLRRYTETHSESAFTELVERHLALVYSAALRQVNGDAHLAQDVAQTVFTELARKAAALAGRPVLTGWLYTCAHFAAVKAVRAERRRHTHEEEAQCMNQLLCDPAPDLDWARLRPVLDAVMLELNETDREAVLLRYFDNRPHAEIAARLGLSENAARMRVERALDKLHALLSRRGVSTTAALSAVISVHAVQAAPAGLAATLSTAALAGTTLTTAATSTAIQTIAMTTLQKTVITAALAAAVGTGIYEARQASTLRSEVQVLQEQQASLNGQIQQLQSEREDAARQHTVSDADRLHSNVDASELLRLRGEVGLLRRQISATKTGQESTTNQMQFTLPYFKRETWSEKGTDEPLNTILTMFWAIRQGDETKLDQIVSRANGSQALDQLTLPKRDWDKIAGVQIVNVSEAQLMMEGRLQDSANIDVIVEKALPVLGSTVKDFNVRHWSLTKTNDNWLITGGR